MNIRNTFVRSVAQFPTRSFILSDSTHPIYSLIESAIQKSRDLIRGFSKKNLQCPTEAASGPCRLITRKNFRPEPNFVSKFFSLRPQIIHKVTTRWARESLAGYWSKQLAGNFLSKRKGPLICFVGFALAKKPSLLTDEEESEGLAFLIRDSFAGTYKSKVLTRAQHNTDFSKGIGLKNLKFGEMIAKGCNAAVYIANLLTDSSNDLVKQDLANDTIIEEAVVDNFQPTKIFMSHSEGEESAKRFNVKSCSTNDGCEKFDDKDVAVKVMFNYNAESNAFAIWNAMYKETLPVAVQPIFPKMGFQRQRKLLDPHPNIVKMHCAFSDQLPLLPDAFHQYPSALPKRLLHEGLGRNMTLFIVQKRYHSNLKDFLSTHTSISAHTSLLLLTQLLEGLVHLLQNNIAHRDLKSDNFLLDLSEGNAHPKLVITDFGCCLESLHLDYQHYEISKGGNFALMAPEVVKADVGMFTCINYSRSDLWTAGTLAYEIYGAKNPFYVSGSNLSNENYTESDLPAFPSHAPRAIQRLVRDMLQRDPNKRPSQNFAASVCQLLLHAPERLLKGTCDKKDSENLLDWLTLMSAETFLKTTLLDKVEESLDFELRHTFCSRIQYMEVLRALRYIQEA